MNPAIERQIARLRMRFAKSPLPRFFAWWWGELLACLPARWRSVLSERSESLLLDVRADEIIVWRERGDSVSEYARIPRTIAPEEQGAEFQRLRAAVGDPMVRTVFCIPSDRVLTRTLSLPGAAEENLRQVLSFEMDRQTPFKPDQIYFDSHVLGRDASGRNAQVELVLIPRAQLDRVLAMLPPAAQLDGVDSWNAAAGAGRRHVNLLPPERRVHRRNVRLPLILGLGALAIILLVMNMNESLANRAAALDAMRTEVDATSAEAKQVASLHKTLADSIASANFLADRKRNGLLITALLNDLTQRLPDDTYLERLQLTDKQVQMQGQAKEAAKLIALLSESPCLSNPGFQGQIQPDPKSGKDKFQITADFKQCSPAMFPPSNEADEEDMADTDQDTGQAGQADAQSGAPAAGTPAAPGATPPAAGTPAAPGATPPAAGTPAAPGATPPAAGTPAAPGATPPAAGTPAAPGATHSLTGTPAAPAAPPPAAPPAATPPAPPPPAAPPAAPPATPPAPPPAAADDSSPPPADADDSSPPPSDRDDGPSPQPVMEPA